MFGILAGVLVVLTIITLSHLRKLQNSVDHLSGDVTDLRQKLIPFLVRLKKPEVPKPAAPKAPIRPPIPPPAPAAESREPFAAPPPKPAAPAPRPTILAPVLVQSPAGGPEIGDRIAAKVNPIFETAREILRKIWSWIVVGEEHRPAGVSMEYAVATTWLIRAGIIAIVTCVGYFLKWSIDRGLVGPEARVGFSIFFGLALLVSGVKLLGRKWHVLGQGFLGGGIAILYFSVFAAGPLYHLVPTTVAFGLMILVTVAAGILAVRLDSLLVAILGIVGGYATPVLLRTGQPNLPVLYSYLLLLGLGILGIARRKNWRLLNYLGFVFTYALYIASAPGDARPQFALMLTFLSLFFVLHSSLVFFHNILHAIKATVLEIIHLLANAAVYSWLAYWLIRTVCGRPYPAVMTLALSVFFIVHVWIFLKRRVADRTLLITLLALSALYATITMPLVMEKETLTISWSLLALMFLWLGAKLDNAFLRRTSHALYLVVFGRLVLLDLPSRFGLVSHPVIPIAEYWKGMADRLWTFGISIGSILTAFFIERKIPAKVMAPKPEEAADAGRKSVMGIVLYWFLALFLFAYLQLETYNVLGYFLPLRQPALTLLWCGMAAYFLWRYFATSRPSMFAALFVFLAVAITKTVIIDLGTWNVCEAWYFLAAYSPLYVAMRWLDFAGLLGFLAAAWLLFRRPSSSPRVHLLFGYGGLALLFVFTTLETRSFLYWKLREFLTGGTSVLWALFAIAFLTGGIWKNVKTLRFAGLGLFIVVVGKVFLVDLADMPTIYRVIAFMAVGIFLLGGAFAYIRASKAFGKES